MNRLDEVTPEGSIRYEDLGNDRARRVVTLSPETQKAYDLERQVDTGTNRLALQGVGQASKILGTPFSLNGLTPEASTGSIEADRANVTNALMSRMEPQFERDRAAMEQRLADQGIQAGNEAYDRSMDELNRAKTDARLQAVLQAGAEGRAQRADMAQLRQRELQEKLLGRSQPINEIGALLGTGQVGMPNFAPAAGVNVANTDVMRPIENEYAAKMAGWNAQAQRQNGLMNGLFGLGGALGSAYLTGGLR